MDKSNQPETLQVIADNQNDHENVDGSVGCEGGARSSSRQSTIHSDRPSRPIDTVVKDMVKRVTEPKK